jgi:hypothetical protein
MSKISIGGQDTIMLGLDNAAATALNIPNVGLPLQDFCNGTILDLTFDENLANVQAGKNGNVITNYKVSGRKAKAVLKALRGGDVDILLSAYAAAMNNDFSNLGTLNITVVKPLGNLGIETTNCTAGTVTKYTNVKSDVDGDIEQSNVTWELTFGRFTRVTV